MHKPLVEPGDSGPHPAEDYPHNRYRF